MIKNKYIIRYNKYISRDWADKRFLVKDTFKAREQGYLMIYWKIKAN